MHLQCVVIDTCFLICLFVLQYLLFLSFSSHHRMIYHSVLQLPEQAYAMHFHVQSCLCLIVIHLFGRRWKLLHPDDVLKLQKNNKIQKIALVSNFVGRRKERPALQPSDFIPQGAVYHEDNQVTLKRKRCELYFTCFLEIVSLFNC